MPCVYENDSCWYGSSYLFGTVSSSTYVSYLYRYAVPAGGARRYQYSWCQHFLASRSLQLLLGKSEVGRLGCLVSMEVRNRILLRHLWIQEILYTQNFVGLYMGRLVLLLETTVFILYNIMFFLPQLISILRRLAALWFPLLLGGVLSVSPIPGLTHWCVSIILLAQCIRHNIILLNT